MSKDFDTIVIFQLMANLEQCGSRIPDVHFVKLTFLFIVIEILNLLGANRYCSLCTCEGKQQSFIYAI